MGRKENIEALYGALDAVGGWTGMEKFMFGQSGIIGVSVRTVKEYMGVLIALGRVEKTGRKPEGYEGGWSYYFIRVAG